MTNIRGRSPLRFYNPIAGRPVPFNLSGLFLFHPETLLKLHGSSYRRMLSEEFDEAFYKKCERVLSGKQRASSRFVAEFLARLPAGFPLTADFRAAFEGDASAKSRVESLGPWALHFLGSGEKLELMSGRGQLFVALERASIEPLRLIADGAITEAVLSICANPVLSMYLWPEVVDAMRQCNKAEQLLPAQAAVSIEVLLSYLAAADAELASKDGSVFACLLPRTRAPGKNPTSLFFAFLCDAIEVKTLGAFLDHPKAKKMSLDMATLKRWSAGTHYPDPVWLRRIMKEFFGDANYAPVKNRYLGAKYLGLIGYLGQTIAAKAQALTTQSEQGTALRPWPSYPFGYADCESWMQVRYRYWFDYHLRQKESLSGDAGEKRPMGLFS